MSKHNATSPADSFEKSFLPILAELKLLAVRNDLQLTASILAEAEAAFHLEISNLVKPRTEKG